MTSALESPGRQSEGKASLLLGLLLLSSDTATLYWVLVLAKVKVVKTGCSAATCAM